MTSTNHATEPNDTHRDDDQTGLLLVDDGVVIYDVDRPGGWIKSDNPVTLAANR